MSFEPFYSAIVQVVPVLALAFVLELRAYESRVLTGGWWWYSVIALGLAGLGFTGGIYALAVGRDIIYVRAAAGIGSSMLAILVFGNLVAQAALARRADQSVTEQQADSAEG